MVLFDLMSELIRSGGERRVSGGPSDDWINRM